MLVRTNHATASRLHIHGWLTRKDSSWTLVIHLVLRIIEEILVTASATDICSSDHVLVVAVRMLPRPDTLRPHIAA